MKRVVMVIMLGFGAMARAFEASVQPGPGPQSPPAQAAEPEVTQWTETVDLQTPFDEGRGNWFKKKDILQKARRLYPEIQAEGEQVQKQVHALQAAHAPEIERRMEILKESIFEPELLAKKVKEFADELEKVSAQERRTAADRQELIDLHDSKKIVDAASEELTYLFELQRGMVEALSLLKAQAERVSAYEKQAWKLYELIDGALNDTIAQQLFDEMQVTAENVRMIDRYVQHDLKKYIETTLQEFDRQREIVVTHLNLLRERGILGESKAPEQSAVQPEKIKAATYAWWQWPLVPFIWLWNWIKSFFI